MEQTNPQPPIGISRAAQIAGDRQFLRDVQQVLGSTETNLRAALAGLEDGFQRRRPVPNEWAIVEVLCHLRDLEREVFPIRTALIRKDNRSTLIGFDQEQWARERQYASSDSYRALEDFCAARRSNLELLHQIGDCELECSGLHSEFGALTLRALLADWAGSDLVHTAQIQRIRLWRFFPEMGPFQQYFKSALRLKD